MADEGNPEQSGFFFTPRNFSEGGLYITSGPDSYRDEHTMCEGFRAYNPNTSVIRSFFTSSQ